MIELELSNTNKLLNITNDSNIRICIIQDENQYKKLRNSLSLLGEAEALSKEFINTNNGFVSSANGLTTIYVNCDKLYFCEDINFARIRHSNKNLDFSALSFSKIEPSLLQYMMNRLAVLRFGIYNPDTNKIDLLDTKDTNIVANTKNNNYIVFKDNAYYEVVAYNTYFKTINVIKSCPYWTVDMGRLDDKPTLMHSENAGKLFNKNTTYILNKDITLNKSHAMENNMQYSLYIDHMKNLYSVKSDIKYILEKLKHTEHYNNNYGFGSRIVKNTEAYNKMMHSYEYITMHGVYTICSVLEQRLDLLRNYKLYEQGFTIKRGTKIKLVSTYELEIVESNQLPSGTRLPITTPVPNYIQ